MAKFLSHKEISSRLHERKKNGKAILIYGAGSGFSAKCAETGGADIIAIYSTAINRMRGLPPIVEKLGYCNCNELVAEQSRIILPIVKNTPCIAGVGAHDPLLNLDLYLDELKALGFSGIVNEPFAGAAGKTEAAMLENAGFGFSKEVEMINLAHKKGMFTLAWCFDAQQAKIMVNAGADIIGTMVLFGKDGVSRKFPFEDAIDMASEIRNAAKEERSDVLVITHGPAFSDPESARRSVQLAKADGYACGSSGERIPAQNAVISAVEAFCDIDLQ